MSWWRRLLGLPNAVPGAGVAPNGETIIGTVVGGPVRILGAPFAGCLGGPRVFDIPELTLELDDRRRITIEPASKATIENDERLESPPPAIDLSAPPPNIPPPSTITYTPKLLAGRIELRNVVPAGAADRYHAAAPYRLIIFVVTTRIG